MRASKFIILGLLALFLSPVYSAVKSDTYYYSTSEQAFAACQAGYAIKRQFIIENYGSTFYYDQNCGGLGQFTNFTFKVAHYSSHTYKDFFIGTGCNSSQTPDPLTGECLASPPPPTDQECQQITETIYATLDINSGSAPTSMNYGGCSFSLKYNISSDSDIENNCKFNASNPDIIICPVFATGTSSTTNPDTSGFSDTVPIGDFTNQSGGDQSTTTTTTPTTTTADTPSAGDITNEYTYTEAVTTSRKDEIYNNESGIEQISQGLAVETNQQLVEEVIKANGDVVTTTTETYNKTEQSKDVTKIDQNGDVTTKSEPTPAQTGSTTTINYTYVDGTSTTNVTNTGVGGDGKADKGTEEGNCSPGEECKVTIDESGIDESGSIAIIANEVAKLKTTRDGVINDMSGDGDGDFGLSGVTGYGASNFVTRYLELPSSTCSGGINTTIFGRPFVIEPCVKLQPLRDVLGWVFFIMTFFTCIKILLNTRSL